MLKFMICFTAFVGGWFLFDVFKHVFTHTHATLEEATVFICVAFAFMAGYLANVGH